MPSSFFSLKVVFLLLIYVASFICNQKSVILILQLRNYPGIFWMFRYSLHTQMIESGYGLSYLVHQRSVKYLLRLNLADALFTFISQYDWRLKVVHAGASKVRLKVSGYLCIQTKSVPILI